MNKYKNYMVTQRLIIKKNLTEMQAIKLYTELSKLNTNIIEYEIEENIL